MSRQSRGLPKKLKDDYKKLPLKARIKILVLARRVSREQKAGK